MNWKSYPRSVRGVDASADVPTDVFGLHRSLSLTAASFQVFARDPFVAGASEIEMATGVFFRPYSTLCRRCELAFQVKKDPPGENGRVA